jgi:hypothetical protein
MVDSYYMVPVVDGNDKVQIVKALGVDHITTLAAANVPEDIGRRLPRVKGFKERWRCWSAWTTRVGCPGMWRALQPDLEEVSSWRFCRAQIVRGRRTFPHKF